MVHKCPLCNDAKPTEKGLRLHLVQSTKCRNSIDTTLEAKEFLKDKDTEINFNDTLEEPDPAIDKNPFDPGSSEPQTSGPNPGRTMPQLAADGGRPTCPDCGEEMKGVNEGTKVGGEFDGRHVEFTSDGGDYHCNNCEIVVTDGGQRVDLPGGNPPEPEEEETETETEEGDENGD